MDKIKTVLDTLINEDNIPKEGKFEITENLLECYFYTYNRLFTKSSGTTTRTNTKYARRLAGLNLLKENINRGVKSTEIRAGHVYLVSNPSYPLHYKVGISYDVHKRLAQYQTYSPYRNFVLEKYDFVMDKRRVEQVLLNHPLLNRENGEWILKSNAQLVFNDLAKENTLNYT